MGKEVRRGTENDAFDERLRLHATTRPSKDEHGGHNERSVVLAKIIPINSNIKFKYGHK